MNQGKMTDFFSLAKERTNQETPRERDQSLGKYIPKSTKKNQELSPNRQIINTYSEPKAPLENKDSQYSHINLDECRTYALPFHITRVWKIAKPKLINMRDGNVTTIYKFIDQIHSFIQSHYSTHIKNLNLQVLKNFLEGLGSDELKNFFQKVLPFLARIALEVETLFKDPLLILKQNFSNVINLSKRQVACLMAHMFFCTLHKQNSTQLRGDCNFTNLFRDSKKNKVKLEKIRCVYNYFRRIQANEPRDEIISFERLVLKPKIQGTLNLVFWQKSQRPLKRCIIKNQGSIEDEEGSIQVDFANRMIGGGVLDGGCVQEEIRFLVSPELFVSHLFTEHLLDHEAFLMTGTEIYCKYTGYGETFKFAGNVQDKTKHDVFGRRDSNVLAIDAIDFSRTSSLKIQFKKERILREINKAYIGFWGSNSEGEYLERKTISTGRWGCGAFQGDSQLKLILQWLAASQANREMSFYRFDDKNIDDAERIIKLFKDATVGELFERIEKYSEFVFSENGVSMDLFEFLRTVDT